jgi:hypothetical protein
MRVARMTIVARENVSRRFTYLRMNGSTVSLRRRSINGAMRAMIGSTQGCSSMKLPRPGKVFFSELTSVSDEMNATGMDQKMHSVAVAATLKALPVRLARCGIPTFLQKM